MLIVGMFLISFASSQVDVYPDGPMPIEETTISADVVDAEVVQAEYIYTKSKVPKVTGKFFNLFNSSIFTKLTHFAYRIINGRGILDAEERWVGAEGYLACDRKCTALYLNQDKFKDYTVCKATC